MAVMTDIDNFERGLGLWQDPQGPPPLTGRRTEPARIPWADKVTSVLGMGPIPATKVVKATSIVNENNRLHTVPNKGDLTLAERTTRAPVIRRALTGLERAYTGNIDKQIAVLKGLHGRINLIGDMITVAEAAPVIGSNGEQLSPEEAKDAHDTLRDKVSRATIDGSKEHLIHRERRKAKEIGILLLDYPVFLLAMMGLLNVSLTLLFRGDGPTIIMFVTAAVFALLGTLLFAVLMRTMGRRHRRFKGPDSAISATGVTRRRILIEQIVTVTITVAAAIVMGTRIYSEGILAEAPLPLVVILSVLFAILVGVSGYINYMSEYENGSEATDTIQHLSARLSSRTGRLNGLRGEQSVLIEEAGIKLAVLHRTIAREEERAQKTVTTSTADKAIIIARSYCGFITPLPAPDLASPTLALIKKQAEEVTEHHSKFKPATTSNQED
jgi:hypothetical protein